MNYGLRYEYTWPWTNPGRILGFLATPAQPAHLYVISTRRWAQRIDLIQEISRRKPVFIQSIRGTSLRG